MLRSSMTTNGRSASLAASPTKPVKSPADMIKGVIARGRAAMEDNRKSMMEDARNRPMIHAKSTLRNNIEAAQRTLLTNEVKKRAIDVFIQEQSDAVIATLKKDMGPRVEQDLKKELRAEVVASMKKDLCEEVKDALKAELEPVVNRELRGAVIRELRQQLHESVYQDLHEELYDQVYADLREELKDLVQHDLRKEHTPISPGKDDVLATNGSPLPNLVNHDHEVAPKQVAGAKRRLSDDLEVEEEGSMKPKKARALDYAPDESTIEEHEDEPAPGEDPAGTESEETSDQNSPQNMAPFGAYAKYRAEEEYEEGSDEDPEHEGNDDEELYEEDLYADGEDYDGEEELYDDGYGGYVNEDGDPVESEQVVYSRRSTQYWEGKQSISVPMSRHESGASANNAIDLLSDDE